MLFMRVIYWIEFLPMKKANKSVNADRVFRCASKPAGYARRWMN